MKTTRFFCALAALAAASAMAAADSLSVEPAAFSVERSELTNQYAVLSWTLPDGIDRTVIYRSYGEGGPWAEVADVADAATWTDQAAPLGIPCYYKIAFAATDEDEGRSVGAMCAATVAHRRAQLLERDWLDMTHVKTGVTVIWNAPSKTAWWNGGKDDSNATIAKPGTADESAAFAFDNMRNSAPNIGYAEAASYHAVGVDLGSACHIGFVRCHPRSDTAGNRAKINGMVIYGSNSDSDKFVKPAPAISEPLADYSTGWHEMPSTNPAPFRYVFACNPSDDSWRLMVGELQFYGWPQSAYAGYAIGATELVAVQEGTAVALSWVDNGYATSFTVERRDNGGEWTALATALPATSYTDATVALDGTKYEYRIVTANGEAVSYSALATVIPYAHGDGRGLHVEYRFPVVTTGHVAGVAYRATNAVEIAAAALADERAIIPGVEGSHTNVHVRWNGTLIAPYEGTYSFTAVADGMVSLWIDGVNVLRHRNAAAFPDGVPGSRALTAGEHDIRIVYWKGVGPSGCVLRWGGAVTEETIPASQLKPVVPNALPAEWEGSQTFGNDVSLMAPSDIRVNADGSLDFAISGMDNREQNPNGYICTWRQFTGDFSFVAKVHYEASSKVSGEKAGLMVRAALNEKAPFESFLFRSNENDLGLRSRRSVGGKISEPSNLNGGSTWAVNLGGKTAFLRLKRVGDTFTCSYRTSTSAPWTDTYSYTAASGLYGDTVYIGLLALHTLVDDANFTTSTYRSARYAWRFSDVNVRPLSGLTVRLR